MAGERWFKERKRLDEIAQPKQSVGSLLFFAGVDVGARTTKAVVIDGEQFIIGSRLKESRLSSAKMGAIVLDALLSELGLRRSDLSYIVGTGYGRVSLPWTHESVTEIRCHARGAHFLNPRTRTVVDIGGQDSKAISIGANGEVVKFLMNDKCAAGCGRFIESILKHALDTSIHEVDEFEIDFSQACAINSTCTVFAESEVISLLAEGTPKAQIIAGLFKAISSRVANLVRKVGVIEEVAFSGGVAKIQGVRHALEQLLGVSLQSFNGIDPQLVGALGAALIARERFLVASQERLKRELVTLEVMKI